MTHEEAKESPPAGLWRKAMPILIWGGSLLLCALIWRTTLVYVAQQPFGWASLALLPPFLLLVAWLHVYLLAADVNYRELIAAGKIATPEEAARIDAVQLQRHRANLWPQYQPIRKILAPVDFGDSGDQDWRFNWGRRLLPLLFLAWVLGIMVLGDKMAADGLRYDLVSGRHLPVRYNELSIHVAALFAAAILAAITAHQVKKRRHKRIWAEIRAGGEP